MSEYSLLSLAAFYRWIHLLGMAVLVGGAMAVGAARWWTVRGASDQDGWAATRTAAVAYEWVFWPVIAIQILTGIGNAGVRGFGLPGPDSSWGALFLFKLWVVLAVLFLSLARSATVIHLGHGPPPPGRSAATHRLSTVYAAFALVFSAVAYVAVRMAHG